ncbi:MAG: outer membrane beta-barrel protein [Pirellulales bacterium]|nr:outer membrane beta-barrel protein [Pirellulales bacterium]
MNLKSLFIGMALLAVFGLSAAAAAQGLQQPASVNQLLWPDGTDATPPAFNQAAALPGPAPGVRPVGYFADDEDLGAGMATEETLRWTPNGAGRGRRTPRGFEFGGWLQQGFSAAGNNPIDRFNGVVGMNDRHAEYQMNQLWFFLERETAIRGDGWDIGGRVDVMLGTDAYFIQCKDGLEANWNQRERFYQMALPQFYMDVAYNDFTFTMGHFISPLEWESYLAPHNFFYSHSYAFMYAVPGTLTGGLLTWDLTDQAQVYGGFHRGGDQFEDTDGLNALNFIGGVSWESEDEDTYLEFGIDAEEDGPGDQVVMGAISMLRKLGDRTDWMIEYVQGHKDACGNDWYGINQHLIHKINCCWTVGARLEWFRDDDGGVVYGYRQGNLAHGPFIGNFWELTLGLNYQIRQNLLLRNEVRWDWYTADHAGGPRPFDGGDRNRQFLYGIDLIYTF